MESLVFRYQPCCSAPGCQNAAQYKFAATWSDGTVSELKSYGLACEEHREALLERARQARQRLRPHPGEVLGEVCVYRHVDGVLDAELTRLPD